MELLKAAVELFTKQNKAVFKSQNRLDLTGRSLVHILFALFATFASMVNLYLKMKEFTASAAHLQL